MIYSVTVGLSSRRRCTELFHTAVVRVRALIIWRQADRQPLARRSLVEWVLSATVGLGLYMYTTATVYLGCQLSFLVLGGVPEVEY